MQRHIICERDVGLFSLIQQVISQVPWAEHEHRIPIVYFAGQTAYHTVEGFHGADNVWEYYFEPLLREHPVATIPDAIRLRIASSPPSPYLMGDLIDADTMASSAFGDSWELRNFCLRIPYWLDDPTAKIRREAAPLIAKYLRPRSYITGAVEKFWRENLEHHFVIGVHIRGTDAIAGLEKRSYRQGSLNFDRYCQAIDGELELHAGSKLFVATDDEASLEVMRTRFGERVVACDSIRHSEGIASGRGPTGGLIPAYIAGGGTTGAQNGAEAIIESLLLGKCDVLVHNGSGLARTVMLANPELRCITTLRGANQARRAPLRLYARIRWHALELARYVRRGFEIK